MVGTDTHVANSPEQFAAITTDWKTRNNQEEGQYANLFSWLYSIINSTNTIIEYSKKEDIDWTGDGKNPTENKNRILAEARAIRAWAYRHLTYCWGDVPLNLNMALGSNIKTDWERSPVAEVRSQILSDFLFAEKYLSVNPSTPGKITKGAVQHYLAELYLTVGKPDSALFWADKVVSNPDYALITDRYGVKKDEPGVPFMDMFYEGNTNREEGNTEALWVFQYGYNISGGGTNNSRYWFLGRYWQMSWGGIAPLSITIERGGRGQGWVSLTKYAINNYEPWDDRYSDHAIKKYFILRDENANAPATADLLPVGYNYGDTLWIDMTGDVDTEDMRLNWPYSRKVEGVLPNDLTSGSTYHDWIYLRSAETYLLKAEAQLLNGSPADAANTINILRRRSNASDINASDVDIDFILDERARELLFEENRRYTLLRTNKWLERVKKYNKKGGDTASERDELFPIPISVINANLTSPMQQNPGYN